MEKNPLSTAQVFAITDIEYLISILYKDPEGIFKKITESIDEHNIAEHGETMLYLYELLVSKGYSEYGEEFAKNYNIQNEKTC